MKSFPILPIWLMLIISGILIFVIIRKNKEKTWINKSTILELFMVLLLFIINLRIMSPSGKAQVVANNLDIIFVIDKSISMIANDYQTKPRLDGVKEICTHIVDTFEGAKFSIITFDNSSSIVTPLTKDSIMTREAIDIIQVKAEWMSYGSTLNAPIENMLTVLKSSKEKEDRTRILFYISDGEITRENEQVTSFEAMKEYLDNGAVLGFGTKEGATMYIGEDKSLAKDYYGGYMYDTANGQKAISKIDEKNLQKIANDMNVDYLHIENKKDMEQKVKDIKKLTTSNFENTSKSSYEDTYFYLIIPLLLLLLYHFIEYKGAYK